MAFADNVWWTRKARIQTEKRLLSNTFHSEILLVWYSFFGVGVSIYYLSLDSNAPSQELVGVTWIVYSVLILCLSGFIKGQSFKERASLVKECYETLRCLYQRAKFDESDIAKLSTEYDQILGVCENHTDTDYYLALCVEHLTTPGKVEQETGFKKNLDRCPTPYHWGCFILGFMRRLTMQAFFYLLPIIIFIALEYLV